MKYTVSLALFISLAFGLPATPAHANDANKLFSFQLPKEPDRPRSYLLPPLASFVIPGLDQWWEDQTAAGALYTGSAFAGLILAYTNSQTRVESDDSLSSRDSGNRLFALGNQIVMAAGSFSAYHSFRTAVQSRRARGDFQFLKNEETVDELLVAPFEFSHLKKPTTYLPLIGLLVGVVIDQSRNGAFFSHNSYNEQDALFGGAFSYLAGTNEEALFRGYLMPALRESWQSDFWSNSANALLFSAAHISRDNPVPWAQFVGGWYLGYLTQKNEWTLAESIFLHTWWDVLAFSLVYLNESRDPNYRGAARLTLPTITF